jgi:endonuclease-3
MDDARVAAMSAFTEDEVREFYRRMAAARPAPATELGYQNPFTLLVAVVLSAQATDIGVNKATPALFALADTPAKMLALGEERVAGLIRTIGLYRSKAKNLIALSRILVERHGGQVPHDREALEALPGVGRKTANIILNEAFGEPTIAVDTHVFRVANRTGLAPGKTPHAVERELLAVTPPEYKPHAHHWLVLHGRYVCTARSPRCPDCILRDLCRYDAKTVPAASAIPADRADRSNADGGVGRRDDKRRGRQSRRPPAPAITRRRGRSPRP